ncbi:MAG: hypothetical protein HQM00_01705 [Magnetococcales bacterium]|nr:hypothetical protein [Magnetococcales bacterium]
MNADSPVSAVDGESRAPGAKFLLRDVDDFNYERRRAALTSGGRIPRAAELLTAYFQHIERGSGCFGWARHIGSESEIESRIPHNRLRKAIVSDASLAAIIQVVPAHMALGGLEDLPFRIAESGLILLSPALLNDALVLAASARWALESLFHRELGEPGPDRLGLLYGYGVCLIDALPEPSARGLLELMRFGDGAEVWRGDWRTPDAARLRWLAGRLGIQESPQSEEPPFPASELLLPLENILVLGGDSRLRIDPASGLNRYGVPPRPRPEAVHFSSSTASAISEHGFMFCELLRRDLLRSGAIARRGLLEARREVVSAFGGEILRLLRLEEREADVALLPSGTDTELLAVLVARHAAGNEPLVNLLVSPEESGSGVKLAGSGCFFDECSAMGTPVEKGRALWPEGPIPLREIPIRDREGYPRPGAEIDAEFLRVGEAILREGRRILAHVLITSKTGLTAPGMGAVASLMALAPDRVDIVVDACQTRTSFEALGNLVRKGWMVQITGSKFLTGPPFSGALIVPASMRDRAGAVGRSLAERPEIGHASDWSRAWAVRMPFRAAPTAGFGPVFRWLPALMEAELLSCLPESFRRATFERFREALLREVVKHPGILPIEMGLEGWAEEADDFSRLSILSFQVLGSRRDGRRVLLAESACRRLFESLNRDVSALLPGLTWIDQGLARLEAHLGQPVTLGGEGAPITALRLVLGARFFNTIGYLGERAYEAILQSEIADAKRALAKVELLAEHWWRFESEGTME